MTDVTAAPAKKLRWAPPGMRWPAIWAGWVGFAAILVWPLGPVAIVLGVWDLVDLGRKGGKGISRGLFALVVGVVTTLLAYLVWSVGRQPDLA